MVEIDRIGVNFVVTLFWSRLREMSAADDESNVVRLPARRQ